MIVSFELIMGYFDGNTSRLNRAFFAIVSCIQDYCKRHIKILSFISSLLILFLVVFLLFFLRPLPSLHLEFYETNYPINYLNMSDEIFFFQSLGNCAPYSVMGVINILRGEKVNPEALARETGWRMKGNLTFPQGLINLLRRYYVNISEYSLRSYTENEKIIWLKNKVDNGHPVILLVKVEAMQHYLTVIGYDEKGFMIYDSAQKRHDEYPGRTIVDKEDYAGNRYYTNSELMEIWNKGGFAVFFRNWAVVCYISPT